MEENSEKRSEPGVPADIRAYFIALGALGITLVVLWLMWRFL